MQWQPISEIIFFSKLFFLTKETRIIGNYFEERDNLCKPQGHVFAGEP